MTQNVPFRSVIEALLDEATPFPAHYLHRFSDIEPTALKPLLKAWPRVTLKRKLNVLEDLGDLADKDTLLSFEPLAHALLVDPDGPVRRRAILLLSESEDQKLAEVFLEFLTQDDDPEVRAAAATALGQFVYLGEMGKISGGFKREIEESLLLATGSAASQEIRRRALESLGYSERGEVPELIETAYHQKDLDWKVCALNAMGHSSDPRWEKTVLSQLHAPEDELRAEAAWAAGELGLAPARRLLLDLLEDEENPDVRAQIIWALSQIGGEEVRRRLEELIEMEEDGEALDSLEEALDNLALTEDLARFDLLSLAADGAEEGE